MDVEDKDEDEDDEDEDGEDKDEEDEDEEDVDEDDDVDRSNITTLVIFIDQHEHHYSYIIRSSCDDSIYRVVSRASKMLLDTTGIWLYMDGFRGCKENHQSIETLEYYERKGLFRIEIMMNIEEIDSTTQITIKTLPKPLIIPSNRTPYIEIKTKDGIYISLCV